MNKVSKSGQVASFAFYITLQMAVMHFTVHLPMASCFVYVAFLMLLPRHQEGLATLLLISFAVGFLVDTLYNSVGIHAFASVLMVYSRSLLLRLLLPSHGYEVAIQPTMSNLGWRKFFLFALILISIHHTALFLLDAGTAMLFFAVGRKIVLSTLLTFAVVLITQMPTVAVNPK